MTSHRVQERLRVDAARVEGEPMAIPVQRSSSRKRVPGTGLTV